MSDNSGLDQIITDQVTALLEDTQSLPPEFFAGIQQWLTNNPPALQSSDLAGGTLTPADGSPHSVAWGSGTITFSGTQSASDAQLHGLGGIPVVVFAFPSVASCVLSGTADGVHVTTTGWFTAVYTGTVPYFWLAII